MKKIERKDIKQGQAEAQASLAMHFLLQKKAFVTITTFERACSSNLRLMASVDIASMKSAGNRFQVNGTRVEKAFERS